MRWEVQKVISQWLSVSTTKVIARLAKNINFTPLAVCFSSITHPLPYIPKTHNEVSHVYSFRKEHLPLFRDLSCHWPQNETTVSINNENCALASCVESKYDTTTACGASSECVNTLLSLVFSCFPETQNPLFPSSRKVGQISAYVLFIPKSLSIPKPWASFAERYTSSNRKLSALLLCVGPLQGRDIHFLKDLWIPPVAVEKIITPLKSTNMHALPLWPPPLMWRSPDSIIPLTLSPPR
jgi:hypothetical protein